MVAGGKKSSSVELSVVIPFFNEGLNVTNVLESISSVFKKGSVSYEILAVDNGSQDNTGKLIDKMSKKDRNIKKVKVEVNKGFGYGILQGMKVANGNYIGFMGGDNQIPADSALKVYNKMKATNSEVGKVFRKSRVEPLIRTIESFGYNCLMLVMFGLPYRDINASPKIMEKKAYKYMKLTSHDWFIDAEILIKARRAKFRVTEVAVPSSERKVGKSKVRLNTSLEFMLNMLKYRFGG